MSRVVIFVGYIQSEYLDYFVDSGYTIGYLYDQEDPYKVTDTEYRQKIHFFIPVNFASNQGIIGSLSEIFVNPDTLLICIRDRYFSSSILIAHLFGLKQANLMSVEQANEIITKSFQRKCFKDKNPAITINYKKIRTFHGAYTFTRKYGFPVIVKPVALSQSQLVNICTDLEDLIKKVSYVLDHVQQTYKQNHVNRKAEVIIEEFIAGRQFSVDSYVSIDGKIAHTPICQQTLGYDLGEDNFETIYSVYPAEITKTEEELIFNTVSQAIESLGIRGNPTHTEVRLTPKGECKVIEVNIRTGGFRATMLKASYGINHVENVIRTYLGQDPVVPTKLLKYSACPQFWPDKEGVLESIEGLEEVEKMDGVIGSSGPTKIGKYVGPANKGFSRSYHVIVTDKDKKSLFDKISKVRNLIKLVVN